LPEADWEYAEWKLSRVNIDYHIEVDGFFYSVPHALIHADVDVRGTARMIEIFHRGQRVGLHERRYMGHGTIGNFVCVIWAQWDEGDFPWPDAKNRESLTRCSTNCWRAPIRKQRLIQTACWTS
jgi:hypothetical protein